MKKVLSFTLALIFVVVSLFSCGPKGIEEKGEVITVGSQLDALTQLNNGTVDVAVIDSVMAGYYTSKGDFANSLEIVDGLVLATEQYGIAGRKNDIAFMDKINEALIGVFADGTFTQIANAFGVNSSAAINAQTTATATGTDNSWANIQTSGKIVIGYTVFAPIAYTSSTEKLGADEFTGFDIELARAVVAKLNSTYSLSLAVEFQEIEWDAKESLLADETIDLIWNGLTITEERQAAMAISIPYLNNKQVAVVKKNQSANWNTTEKLAKATIGVESGSAGEDVANGLVK